MPGSGIFISYRRDDSAGFAGRLYDRLVERFGADRVFMDIDTISPGHEFATDIEKALTECDACVVLIGRDWLTIRDADGGRRLDDPTDFVRLEVGTAIRRGITVFPVMVDKANPPSSAALPNDIRPLAGRQAIELTNERWNYDVGRLLLSLEEEVGPKEPPPRRPERPRRARSMKGPALIAGGVFMLLAVAVVGWLVTRSPTGGAEVTSTSQEPPQLKGTYDVAMTLTSFSGTLAYNDDLWDEHNPQVGVNGDAWSSQHWTFKSESWSVQERGGITGILGPDGTYTAAGEAHCGTDSAHSAKVVRRFVPMTGDPAGSTAQAFSGVLTIHWDCVDTTGKVDATFNITGTRSG